MKKLITHSCLFFLTLIIAQNTKCPRPTSFHYYVLMQKKSRRSTQSSKKIEMRTIRTKKVNTNPEYEKEYDSEKKKHEKIKRKNL